MEDVADSSRDLMKKGAENVKKGAERAKESAEVATSNFKSGFDRAIDQTRARSRRAIAPSC